MDQVENRLLSVVEHWLPRIEVAGIPSATARAVIEQAGTWANWLPAWCAEGDRHAQIASATLAAGHEVTAGEAYARASLFYHFGQFMAFEDLPAKAAAAARKAELYRLALPLLDPPGEIIEIPFEDGHLRAALRTPAGADPRPLAVILPGSDSTKEEFPALERHFHARGIATLSLDGPGQGEGRSHGRLRPDVAPAVQAAIDAVSGRSELSGQVGLVGMAFGGFLALRASAHLRHLEGIVSINGFFDLGGLWTELPQVYRDNMHFSLGSNDVPQRAATFTLKGCDAPGAPTLIVHGGRDRIFPPAEAEACARFCRNGADLHLLPGGNHVCNNIPWLYRPMVADWLADRFRRSAGPQPG